MKPEIPLFQRLGTELIGSSKEPLSPTVKRAVLALVIFFHVGGGWALTQVEPVKLVVGDIAPMEVRMVPAEQAAEPEVENAEPPPPVFPTLEKKPEPKPEHKPVQKKPPAPVPQAPVDNQPQQATPRAASAPKTISASQLGYLVPPNPIYPARSRKAGEQGTVMVRVLLDVAGRPAQVSLQTSSGHPTLDESAVSAVRAAQFRPYVEGGMAQAVWVLVPINFVLR